MLACSGCCLQQPPSPLGRWAHSLLFPFSLPCLGILAHSRHSSHPCPPREHSKGFLVSALCSSTKCDPTLTGTRQKKKVPHNSGLMAKGTSPNTSQSQGITSWWVKNRMGSSSGVHIVVHSFTAHRILYFVAFTSRKTKYRIEYRT